ncbi:hypothetical protein [Propionispora hippei]|uniref:PEP-CTERM protein-sorting domain-containing protein n=1 Tax=Propionispora hippei DSM 15287 TaxID=1123003 RepID=A0A1M6LA60_9FIRM|nr:hypothetical protein [Propionispora hippei]SHJ68090.1 PEP-CTERM protein-sorting domain-containing protein [Propionispora hippei DSM 15287]
MPTLPDAPTKPVPPTVTAPAPLNSQTSSPPAAQPSAGTTTTAGKEQSRSAAGSEKPAGPVKTNQKTAVPDNNSTTPAAPATAETGAAASLAPVSGSETTAATTAVPAKAKAADGLFPSTVSSWLLATVLLIGLAGWGLSFLKKKKPSQPVRTVIDYSGRSKIIANDSGVDVTIAPPSSDKPQVKSHFEVRI